MGVHGDVFEGVSAGSEHSARADLLDESGEEAQQPAAGDSVKKNCDGLPGVAGQSDGVVRRSVRFADATRHDVADDEGDDGDGDDGIHADEERLAPDGCRYR